MIHAKTTVSLLLAGLLAGGAYAQSASGSSDVPLRAGEHSTVTHGQPNMATSNDSQLHPPAVSSTADPINSAAGLPVDSASSSDSDTAIMGAPSEPRVLSRDSATVTSNVPTRAGEASTMTNGVPNMSTHNPVVDSRVLYPPELVLERVPSGAGEASTMVGGRPNWNPDDPLLR